MCYNMLLAAGGGLSAVCTAVDQMVALNEFKAFPKATFVITAELAVSAPQFVRETWVIVQHGGPNRLGLRECVNTMALIASD